MPSTLADGALHVEGRLVDASNVTLLCEATDDTGSRTCVYKPIAGERPLWDFPTGSLAGREVATYLLCDALGWSLVPPTVLRDGPYGPGMCQQWIDNDPEETAVDLVAVDAIPAGWVEALQALDEDGGVVALVHAASEDVRRTALLDILANNADRKGSHLLAGTDGLRVVDHGLCFHEEPKLRTVLWGFGGLPLAADEVAAVTALRAALDGGDLGARLTAYITPAEVEATVARADGLLAAGVFPLRPEGWRSLPWPPL